MGTPHIDAQPGDFAPTVLMPGDPLRAKFIAETFLSEARLVSSVRNVLAFTGIYEGTPVSVMGSGMGIPSISIYATELYREFGVEHIIRVGSCGAVAESIALRDVLIGMGACTDSQVNRARFGGMDYAAIADFQLLRKAVETAEHLEISVRVGSLHSSDLFYDPRAELLDHLESMGVLGIEMEAAGLYGCAAECGKSALAICTVSDHLRRKESMAALDRERSLKDMCRVALETVSKL